MSSGFDLVLRRLGDGEVIYRRGEVSPTARGDARIELLRLRVPEGPPREESARERRWERAGPEDDRPDLHHLRSILNFARRAREPRWELVAVHSEGSLDAAVAHARHRNLAISLGILVLLTASLALLLHSTRRSRRLARQQLEFVAGVTHELMTPLAAMRSAGQNLADGVVRDPDQVVRYGRLVDREGKRLADMVGQVLALAGMGFGERAPERRAVAAGELLDRVLADFSAELEGAGFEVELSVGEPEPVIAGDFESLRRALGNLVGNALKYAASGAWLRLSARRVGRWVELEVADRGGGIAPEEQPHIFEPFRRGSGLSASTIPGSGLGLSLVRSTVEGHGGTVRLESSNGGTTFNLRLPAMDGEESER
jgi:signal transduction histidine kinase